MIPFCIFSFCPGPLKKVGVTLKDRNLRRQGYITTGPWTNLTTKLTGSRKQQASPGKRNQLLPHPSYWSSLFFFKKLTPTKSTSLTEFCLLNSLLSPGFLHQPVPHHGLQCSFSTMGLIETNHPIPSVQGSSLQDPNQSQQSCCFAAIDPRSASVLSAFDLKCLSPLFAPVHSQCLTQNPSPCNHTNYPPISYLIFLPQGLTFTLITCLIHFFTTPALWFLMTIWSYCCVTYFWGAKIQ